MPADAVAKTDRLLGVSVRLYFKMAAADFLSRNLEGIL